MKRLIWSGPAIRDISTLLDYYAKLSPDLAAAMRARILEAPGPLLERPLLGEAVGLRGARKWSVKGAPFVLRYRVAPDRIEILRVHHNAQNWRAE